MFQSPSLRGSGRFQKAESDRDRAQARFQSPSLRGSGRFVIRLGGQEGLHHVSIPFIAGQWSLRVQLRLPVGDDAEFQSPSLRGSGRFALAVWRAWVGEQFQSPSLRGSGRFALAARAGGAARGPVSIPFIAGQWSLPGEGRAAMGPLPCFNPLHCGAVVASCANDN